MKSAAARTPNLWTRELDPPKPKVVSIRTLRSRVVKAALDWYANPSRAARERLYAVIVELDRALVTR